MATTPNSGKKTARSLVHNPPKPPVEVVGEAKKEWNRIVALLKPFRILHKLDRAILFIYVTSWATYLEATRVIATEGMTIETTKGLVRHPCCDLQEKAWNRCKSISYELGLSPAARHRLGISEEVAATSAATLLSGTTK